MLAKEFTSAEPTLLASITKYKTEPRVQGSCVLPSQVDKQRGQRVASAVQHECNCVKVSTTSS